MDKDTSKTRQTNSQDKSLPKFEADEQKADQGWEKEKDIISGVDKSIEKKLDEGNLQPGDTQNLGD